MQRLEVSGAVRPIYGSLGVKQLIVRNVVTCTSVRRDVRIDGQMDITGAHLPTNCLREFSFKF